MGKKRIAYIGLSSPIFYDYRTQSDKTISGMISNPNPILDCPYGIMLFYDEIWFLCESLCPINMRNLPYVRFMDKEGTVNKVILEKSRQSIQDIEWDAVNKAKSEFGEYQKVVSQVGIKWSAAADNHTHTLNIAGFHCSANSMDPQKYLFDLEIMKNVKSFEMELITNKFTDKLASHLIGNKKSSYKHEAIQILIVDNIFNFIGKRGPYHPCVDEMRENKFLSYFRNWIVQQKKVLAEKEISEIKKEVENAIDICRNEIFYKYLDKSGEFLSVAKTTLWYGMDSITGPLSTITSLVGDAAESNSKENMRWQGFFLQAHDILNEEIRKMRER